jgi:predicted murein hydrolase (TIGR00659 family)
MKSVVITEILFILLTLGAYLTGRVIYRKTKIVWLHSIVTATLLIILFFTVSGLNLSIYEENTRVIKYLLNLSVVAFGYLLHKNYDFIKKRGIGILIANFSGSLIAIISVAVIAIVMGADIELIATMLPKSVTTPIAIVISEQYGGVIYFTAVIVILSGIFGAVTGPWILKKAGIKNDLSYGLSLGAASHGIGTAKAMEAGLLQGAAGGLAIALMGLFTSLLIPIAIPLIKIILFKLTA